MTMLLQAAILTLAQQCAPNVEPSTMAALVASESSGNPYAIGVVGMDLIDQPKTKDEALMTAKALLERGANISVGLGQINKNNFKGLGLTLEEAFEPCPNLRAGGQVLGDCYARAVKEMGEGQAALQAAFSCYYSNNFTRGFVKEGEDRPSYLMMIAENNERVNGVPAIEFKPSDINEVDPSQSTTKNVAQPTEKTTAIIEIQERTPEQQEDPMSWDVLGEFTQP